MIEILEESGETVIAAVLFIVAVGSVFIEVSKIKLNPWSALFKWIGQSMNKDIKDELMEVKIAVEAQSKKIDDIQDEVDRNEIKRIRAEIFAFADSCRLGTHHTKDNFEHIFEIHDDYDNLLDKHQMINGRVTSEFEYIKAVYLECMKGNKLI
ncbi:MAG: hypothetical protein IKU60_03740 [Clostridia bacterium]|nr:hypothetical protein [Clostridia bacterium]